MPNIDPANILPYVEATQIQVETMGKIIETLNKLPRTETIETTISDLISEIYSLFSTLNLLIKESGQDAMGLDISNSLLGSFHTLNLDELDAAYEEEYEDEDEVD